MSDQTEAATPQWTILVVDDSPINLTMTSGLLEMQGHLTVTANDGAEAVALVGQQRFDLVLMDLQMPGMDGLSATRAIRLLAAPAKDVPIIALTANDGEEDRALCLQAGMDDLLGKPITNKRLASLLDRWNERLVAALGAPPPCSA
jgi:CheY-like chemotaxis protein